MLPGSSSHSGLSIHDFPEFLQDWSPNFFLLKLNSQLTFQPTEGLRCQDQGLRNAGNPFLPE